MFGFQPESAEAPTFPAESPAKWLKALKLATAGDREKLAGHLGHEMGLSQQLATLFITAAAEEAELLTTIKAGEPIGDKLAVLLDVIRAAADFKPKTPEEAAAMMKTARERQSQLNEWTTITSAAETAHRHLDWLRIFFSEFFCKPLPPHAGYLGSAQPAPKTWQELVKLSVDPWTLHGWRKVGIVDLSPAERRRMVYSSFSPVGRIR